MLQGIRELVRAIRGVESPSDNIVADLVASVRARPQGLGMAPDGAGPEKQVAAAAAQLTQAPTDAQQGQAIEHIKERENIHHLRVRVAMQVAVSLVVLVPCVATLTTASPPQNLQNILSGLIGIVLGYWLR